MMASSAAAGGGGVEGDARLAAEGVDGLDGAVEVGAGLDVDGEPVASRLCERFEERVRVGYHEMRVERQICPGTDRAHEARPEREVGDEVAVHHVDVEEVGATPLHVGDLLREPGEVR